MGTIKINKNIIKEINYFSCVKCGSENINFGDMGYSSFNVAYAKCNNCKNEVIIKLCDWNISKEQIIEIWNNSNDPNLLREKYQNEINRLQDLINNLPK